MDITIIISEVGSAFRLNSTLAVKMKKELFQMGINITEIKIKVTKLYIFIKEKGKSYPAKPLNISIRSKAKTLNPAERRMILGIVTSLVWKSNLADEILQETPNF